MATPRYEDFPRDIDADIGDPFDTFAIDDLYTRLELYSSLFTITPEGVVALLFVRENSFPLTAALKQRAIQFVKYDESGRAIAFETILYEQLAPQYTTFHVTDAPEKALQGEWLEENSPKAFPRVNIEAQWRQANGDPSYRQPKTGFKFQNP